MALHLKSTGIDFTDFSDEAGMTSELLDDYEEGTFEPTVSLATVGDSTCTEKIGNYVKIGKVVCCHGRFRFAKGTTGDGNLSSITGLPFTTLTQSGGQSATYFASVGVGRADHTEIGRIDAGGSSSIAYMFKSLSTGGSSTGIHKDYLATYAYVRFSLSYCTA
jgi:hypothetical protein